MSADKSTEKLIEDMSFEEAMSELELIVQKIDEGRDNLSTSIENFERGIKLRKHCQLMLDNAKMKIEKITQKEDEISVSDVNLD